MEYANLTPIENMTDCPFPFFDYEPIPAKAYYKVYNDGGHYIATHIFRSQAKVKSHSSAERDDIDILFDSLYNATLQDGLKADDQVAYIKAGILKLFPHWNDLDGYVADKFERKRHNLYARKKRFRRKANLNKWNYFVTFTYDDGKQDADTFRKKLRCCLSHLHTRRGWRYMGVFERAPESGRLHFHGLLYVPDGEMIGNITERTDYSTAQGKMQTTHPNDFFEKAFGRNDFEELDEMELRHGQTLNYILMYIGKTGERIVYSRGIPTEVCVEIKADDIITDMQDYGTKYILFDDVITWERDVMNFKRKQVSIFDLLCNPTGCVRRYLTQYKTV